MSSLSEVDALLRRFRNAQQSEMYLSRIADLPDVSFVELDDCWLWLLWQRGLYRWNPGGYSEKRTIGVATDVSVITPAPIIELLRAGFVPVHHSVAQPSKSFAEEFSAQQQPRTAQKRSVPNNAEPIADHSPASSVETVPAASTAPVVSEPVAQPDVSEQLCKLEKTPAGRKLHVYFAGILRVTEM